MGRVRAFLGYPVERMRGVERFVQLIVVGGISLVSGLWLIEVGSDSVWVVGIVLAVVGVLALGVGIWSEIEV